MAAKRGDPRLSTIYKKRRLMVLAASNYTCFYCGGEANQVDHVVPMAKDSSMQNAIDMDNMVAACANCNRRKSSRSIASFLATTPTPPDCISPLFAPKMATTDHELPRSRTDQSS
jgi:5-methylcytosine-specific restriction endonuclease McrA